VGIIVNCSRQANLNDEINSLDKETCSIVQRSALRTRFSVTYKLLTSFNNLLLFTSMIIQKSDLPKCRVQLYFQYSRITWLSSKLVTNYFSRNALVSWYSMLRDSLCSSFKYNWSLKKDICELYILFLTFLIDLSEICIILHEIFWIKFMPH